MNRNIHVHVNVQANTYKHSSYRWPSAESSTSSSSLSSSLSSAPTENSTKTTIYAKWVFLYAKKKLHHSKWNVSRSCKHSNSSTFLNHLEFVLLFAFALPLVTFINNMHRTQPRQNPLSHTCVLLSARALFPCGLPSISSLARHRHILGTCNPMAKLD